MCELKRQYYDCCPPTGPHGKCHEQRIPCMARLRIQYLQNRHRLATSSVSAPTNNNLTSSSVGYPQQAFDARILNQPTGEAQQQKQRQQQAPGHGSEDYPHQEAQRLGEECRRTTWVNIADQMRVCESCGQLPESERGWAREGRGERFLEG
jgi:hypothetical protein